MMKRLILLICLLATGAGQYLLSQTTEWELRKNEDGIKVYTREVDGSDFDEYKAVMTVKIEPKALLYVICDVSKFTEWMPDIEEAKMLKKESADMQIDYTETNAPWPVKNRDAVVQRDIIHGKNGEITINMKALPDYIPEKDGIVRIPKMDGFWKMTPRGNGEVEVINQVLADPGGYLPSWLVNAKVVDDPWEIMQGLEKMAKKDEAVEH